MPSARKTQSLGAAAVSNRIYACKDVSTCQMIGLKNYFPTLYYDNPIFLQNAFMDLVIVLTIQAMRTNFCDRRLPEMTHTMLSGMLKSICSRSIVY